MKIISKPFEKKIRYPFQSHCSHCRALIEIESAQDLRSIKDDYGNLALKIEYVCPHCSELAKERISFSPFFNIQYVGVR